MFTQRDIDTLEKRFERTFVTKDYLHNGLRNLADDLIEFIKVTNSATKKEIIEELEILRSEIRQFAAEVSSVLKNHEGRISTLETERLN